ncbi:MAG TPA: CBS domain-containing protein [Leptospiraceae bacterium]|jgi:acetoin utilization protein AcuB|nr:CBS domain-containing protein [Leptospirales bacterium]HMU85453.1 CBS domain-containing protein [Leptospiraceae bacterium]HMW59826.1 CBS domain-containing protein [Leptospiraceae bacterium]HMX56255.1 CBS domain-containing protein [Leptospiraceae bacterium]HMY47872.1 CBS domain-containing protein [Leptospiraceae bacterium]
MHRAIPPIQKYMTTTPVTVQQNTTIAEAHKLMQEHNFRHLPVMKGTEFFGVVSDRDLKLMESFTGVDPSKATVGDIAHKDAYTISPDAQTDDVVKTMATHKYGSALIIDNKKVVGIFTTVDAMNAFAEVLEALLKK